MPDDEPRKGPSKEAWSAIAAITVALIGAAVTLATHFWTPRAAEHDVATRDTAPPNAPSPAALVGKWAGTATATGASYRVEVEIAPGCTFGARCGSIFVSSVPCRGGLYLQAADGGDFEFRVADFVAPSGPACQEGAGEHLQPQPDGTLLYVTSYEPRARAVLTRQAR